VAVGGGCERSALRENELIYMSQIKLQARTEDVSAQKICQAYWETDANGRFIHKVSDIAGQLGVKQQDVVKYVREHSYAYLAKMVCRRCGDPIVFLKSRSDFATPTRQKIDNEFCPDCQEQVNEQAAELRREQASKARDEKTKQMQLAFENGVYQTLDNLEFKFLTALATCDTLKAATKRVGLSDENADKLFNKFCKLDLINFSDERYDFLPEFEEALKRVRLRQMVKPIFGSPKALQLYRKLKREHLFVYPEVPIAALIQKSDVGELLTEDWHDDYFLRARVDFLICDQEGMPLSAVEYQGGYHKSEHQAKLDKFKEMILRKVGLALREITSQELANL
jgi:hypothetical protein